MAIVLTNCTNRKRGVIAPGLTVEDLQAGPLDSVVQQWVCHLREAPAENFAHEIYCGRSFREAEATAKTLNCPMYIVSAGLGIVKSDVQVPVYNLTVISGTSHSILNKVTDKTLITEWWARITNESYFGTSLLKTLDQHPNGLILIALSRPYIGLLLDELLNVPNFQQRRLRFFGKKLDSALPPALAENWMPYDDRLDGAGPGHSGTQTDFAQRALRHFVNKVLNQCEDGDAYTHRSMVRDSLSSIVRRENPKRRRLSDHEIGEEIRDNWERGKGQSTALLRIIRRDLDIACEQSRFRDIYHSVKKAMGGAT